MLDVFYYNSYLNKLDKRQFENQKHVNICFYVFLSIRGRLQILLLILSKLINFCPLINFKENSKIKLLWFKFPEESAWKIKHKVTYRGKFCRGKVTNFLEISSLFPVKNSPTKIVPNENFSR